jgi:hypothetical protein
MLDIIAHQWLVVNLLEHAGVATIALEELKHQDKTSPSQVSHTIR